MWGQIIFAVFGASVGAVVAAYVVPTYIAPQPEPVLTSDATDVSAEQSSDDATMSLAQMSAELEVLDGEEFDLAFLELMIEYQEEAMDLTQLVEDRSENSELQRFAAENIEAQTADIEQMQAWQEAIATQSAQEQE